MSQQFDDRSMLFNSNMIIPMSIDYGGLHNIIISNSSGAYIQEKNNTFLGGELVSGYEINCVHSEFGYEGCKAFIAGKPESISPMAEVNKCHAHMIIVSHSYTVGLAS